MIKNPFGLSLLLSLGVVFTGCGSDDDGGTGGSSGNCPSGEVECGDLCIPEADGTLEWVQAEVFDTTGCAASSACHNGMNPDTAIGFDLSDEASSFDSFVDVESSQAPPKVRVAPNDVEGSYLVNKLTGEGMAPGTLLMPFGATQPLCDARIDGVRAWIEAGANP